MTVIPYKEKTEGKKEQVATMFNNISRKYVGNTKWVKPPVTTKVTKNSIENKNPLFFEMKKNVNDNIIGTAITKYTFV